MAKTRSVYVCGGCGAQQPRWLGQCPSCGAWNALEEVVQRPQKHLARPSSGPGLAISKLSDVHAQPVPRLKTPVAEWDRVLGGGVVPGSVILVGGDPGVGKSTLLMQIADAIAVQSSVLYVSGEESLPQIGLRARRLGLGQDRVDLSAETDVRAIVDHVLAQPPGMLIVDSIQSVYDPAAESPPGSVTQLRECTQQLHRAAKSRDIAVLLVGHVTKEGVLAGPKMLEHMVDVVLYLEGERLQAYRLLRGVKNRFGATNEVGVFEMRDKGLAEVANPSAAFLNDRVQGGSGSSIVVILEGTRPMLVEVQALVNRSALSVPRRVANGIDYNRVVLLSAVLTKRAGVPFHEQDIHVNVVGGLRIEETAADLGLALAMMSSYRDRPIDPETVAIGEIGLAGELRTVSQMELRLQEAGKLGFRRAVVPPSTGETKRRRYGIETIEAATLREAAVHLGVQ